MTHVKLESPKADPSMTSDLFKLIDGASNAGENKKGLFASIKQTAVKLSRRSIGKEFEHHALAGPSFSNDSDHNRIGAFFSGDDSWNFESRDDWGGYEENVRSSGHREGFENRDQTGFPPLAPSNAKVRPSPNKKRFNPKLQFSATKKKLDKRKPKDFSLTQMISQSFDSDSGSVSARKYLDDEPTDIFEIHDQHTSAVEYAQLDLSGGATKVTTHESELSDYPCHPAHDSETSLQNEPTADGNLSDGNLSEGNLSEQQVLSLSWTTKTTDVEESCTDTGSPTFFDEGMMSFKDRLAFYKNRSPNVNANEEIPKRNSLQVPPSEVKKISPMPLAEPAGKRHHVQQQDIAVSRGSPKNVVSDTSDGSDKSDNNDSNLSQNEPVNPFKVKLRPTRRPEDCAKSVQDRFKGVETKQDADTGDRPVDGSRAKKLSIGGKPLNYIPMLSCSGDSFHSSNPKPAALGACSISSPCYQSPRNTVPTVGAPFKKTSGSNVISIETNVDKPMSIAQRKAMFLSSRSFDAQDTSTSRDSVGSVSTGTTLQNRQSNTNHSISALNLPNDGRESIFNHRTSFTSSHVPTLTATLRSSGKTQPCEIEVPKAETNPPVSPFGMKIIDPRDSMSGPEKDQTTVADRKKALITQFQGSGKMIQTGLPPTTTLQKVSIKSPTATGISASAREAAVGKPSGNPKPLIVESRKSIFGDSASAREAAVGKPSGNPKLLIVESKKSIFGDSASAREAAVGKPSGYPKPLIVLESKKTTFGTSASAREAAVGKPSGYPKPLIVESKKTTSTVSAKQPNYLQVRASLISVKRSPTEETQPAEIQSCEIPITGRTSLVPSINLAESSPSRGIKYTKVNEETQPASQRDFGIEINMAVSLADRKRALSSKLPVSLVMQARDSKSVKGFLTTQESNQGTAASKNAAAQSVTEERSDFAARLQFFKSKSTTPNVVIDVDGDREFKSRGDGSSPTSTKVASPDRAGGPNTADGHPLYVTVDAMYSGDECLSPSPSSTEHQIVCEPTRDDSYYRRLQKHDDHASSDLETELECQATTTEKYHALKTRFSKKALPWRQKNAADRYLERNKNSLHSPDSGSASSIKLTRNAELFCPISNEANVASKMQLHTTEAFNTPSRGDTSKPLVEQSPFGTPFHGYDY